ncbi:alpha-dehydro-beta-deoxy-D-glucarate aldolase [Delftia sp. 670]|nr:alpha-dehydro-beta-deoxy-D-glucarate aldolase [Delftia sp. 670]
MGHGEVGEMLIKQYLDIGVQTLLVPMVDTAEQAARIVRAARYPQADGQGGIRGMGGARASAWGRRANYAHEANAQVCVLAQVETRQALAHLDAIAATEGVDGVFIGPADLSASMGHIGNPGHPEVQEAIADAIARIRRAGKRPASSRPTRPWRASTWSWAAPSRPWAWTPACWCRPPAPWLRASSRQRPPRRKARPIEAPA